MEKKKVSELRPSILDSYTILNLPLISLLIYFEYNSKTYDIFWYIFEYKKKKKGIKFKNKNLFHCIELYTNKKDLYIEELYSLKYYSNSVIRKILKNDYILNTIKKDNYIIDSIITHPNAGSKKNNKQPLFSTIKRK